MNTQSRQISGQFNFFFLRCSQFNIDAVKTGQRKADRVIKARLIFFFSFIYVILFFLLPCRPARGHVRARRGSWPRGAVRSRSSLCPCFPCRVACCKPLPRMCPRYQVPAPPDGQGPRRLAGRLHAHRSRSTQRDTRRSRSAAAAGHESSYYVTENSRETPAVQKHCRREEEEEYT